jgi:hypothetical protein
MPYNKRPLTLYKGQFQVNAGYEFAVRIHSFDSDGNLKVLKDNGTASVFHNFCLKIKFGITDFLEFAAETNYLKKGIRSVTMQYLSSSTESITVNTVNETRGLGDLLLITSLRLPINYKWFDFGIKGGLFLPTAKYKPSRPTHTITETTVPNIFEINYHFNNTNGFGVPVYLLSSAVKFTLSKFSLESDFTFRKPVKEGENIRWDQVMTNKTFTYFNQPYKYLLNRVIDINASIHFQATGWFNIQLNSNYYRSGGGWTEYWGDKYRNPDEQLFSLEPGFEIRMSPAFTVYEFARIPLSGKNIDAPFCMLFTVTYNLFPFKK